MRRRLTWALILCLAVIVAAVVISVATAQEPGPPWFWMGVHDNGIWGEGWPAGVEMTVTVDDPNTAQNPDFELTLTTTAEGEIPGNNMLPVGLEPG